MASCEAALPGLQKGPAQAPEVAGAEKGMMSKVMDTSEGMLQRFAPVSRICQHVCGLHFYAHDMTRQVEAHHYCSHVNEEFRQCIIFDKDDASARLIGIEYIISRRLFESLPEEEKKYWHSHTYEVMSGMLMAPHTPLAAETLEMNTIVDTYGKTFHTWQVDRGDNLPLGPAQLMMAFTKDGQVNEGLLADRDQRYKMSTQDMRAHRQEAVKKPDSKAAGADHWETGKGKAFQVAMQEMDFRQGPGPSAS